MTIANDPLPSNSEPVFTAVLKPYRSLGKTGLRVLFILLGIFSIFNIAFFLATGALPVAMFFGLDFALLFGAFWLNNRAARAREEINLSRTEIVVRKYSPAGLVRSAIHNPFWARFDVTRQDEIGITRMALVERGRSTDLGSFLCYDEKEDFAKAFALALANIKRRI